MKYKEFIRSKYKRTIKEFHNNILLQLQFKKIVRMIHKSLRGVQDRQRKKKSQKEKTNFASYIDPQEKEKRFETNTKKFFINSDYDLGLLHEGTPSASRRSYVEALSTIKSGNNSEIKKIRLNNPFISATEKLYRTMTKIVNRTLLLDLFSYNSLKNRKMSDNEQKFRKRNKQACKQSQNIEQPFYYRCRDKDKCHCGAPRPTYCPNGPRIKVYL